MIRAFEELEPQIAASAWVDASAVVIGDVHIGEECSIWPTAVIRGDVNFIRIDHHSNIQDGSVLHVSHANERNPGGSPLVIGHHVTVGHKVILHGCDIGHDCLIGMGSVIMDDVVVENEVMIGANTLVPPGKRLESGNLYLGNPCRLARKLRPDEIEYLRYSAEHYVRLKNRHINKHE
jgi:carbonic anhydrase/acetyltransferase-like protein (isoleucine patch superfamily)